jgi:hypothetical protein
VLRILCIISDTIIWHENIEPFDSAVIILIILERGVATVIVVIEIKYNAHVLLGFIKALFLSEYQIIKCFDSCS